jgi:hypothetical protein
MSKGRLLATLAVVALLLAVTSGTLTLPDWAHPTRRDYDQSSVLILAATVVVAAYSAWFAWRSRRPR